MLVTTTIPLEQSLLISWYIDPVSGVRVNQLFEPSRVSSKCLNELPFSYYWFSLPIES